MPWKEYNKTDDKDEIYSLIGRRRKNDCPLQAVWYFQKNRL